MTKSELIAAIAAHGNTSKAEAERALASVTDVISTALANGLDVSVPGFGSFSVAVRAERQGRNRPRARPSPSRQAARSSLKPPVR